MVLGVFVTGGGGVLVFVKGAGKGKEGPVERPPQDIHSVAAARALISQQFTSLLKKSRAKLTVCIFIP